MQHRNRKENTRETSVVIDVFRRVDETLSRIDYSETYDIDDRSVAMIDFEFSQLTPEESDKYAIGIRALRCVTGKEPLGLDFPSHDEARQYDSILRLTEDLVYEQLLKRRADEQVLHMRYKDSYKYYFPQPAADDAGLHVIKISQEDLDLLVAHAIEELGSESKNC